LFLVTLCLALTGCHAKRELLYVSCEQSGEIVVIDPLHATIEHRIAVGKRPRGIKLSHDGSRLYIAQTGSPQGGPNVDESKLPPADRAADGIGVVDVRDASYVGPLPGGQDPETFDISPDDKKLYIANEETAELSVLDIGARKVVQRIAVGKQPEGVSVRPDGAVVYVTSEEDDNVSAIDTKTGKVRATIATGKRPRAIAFARGGPTLLGFITNEVGNSLTIFDTANEQPLQTLPIVLEGARPQRPMGAVATQDGKHLYVSTGRGGAVAVLDVEHRKLDHFIKDVGARPWGIALSPDGKRLYTANGPSHDISIIELASGKIQHV
jgi:YVTN family beta-propeller protein